MARIRRVSGRPVEGLLLIIVFLLLALGFLTVAIAQNIQAGASPLPALGPALVAPLAVGLLFAVLHLTLRLRRLTVEQILIPAMGLIFAVGLVMIWRLRGSPGVWQQLTRGFIPGVLAMLAFVIWPGLIERVRRAAIPISIVGLLLPILTAFFGVVDETGARLSLKLGPLPPIQTSEILKVALLVFLAWFIEREGREAEGRARVLFGRLRLPAPRYFIPGLLFVGMATLALVQMSDFGAVLILGVIFVLMLYAGFETRLFATVAAIGAALALLVGLGLALAGWEAPTVIQYRFLAFQNPWSDAPLIVNGQPSEVTIAQGPGYQIQQSIYAVVAGGITGAGLGFGRPEFVPLSSSDFIFAALLEELGAIIGLAVLIIFTILLLRILRTALMLPPGQVFERLLLIGICIHLFTQVFIMVGGTLNLIPLTGVTIPFLSLGGVALLVNLAEVGMVLAVMQRLQMRPQTQ